LAEQDPVNL